MRNRLITSMILITLLNIYFNTLVFSNAVNAVEIREINIISPSSSHTTVQLNKEDVRAGYKELAPVELNILSNVDWKLIGKITFVNYPNYEPPKEIVEYYDPYDLENPWKPLDGAEILTGPSNVPSGEQFFTVMLRYNLMKWEEFCSGKYIYDLELKVELDS